MNLWWSTSCTRFYYFSFFYQVIIITKKSELTIRVRSIIFLSPFSECIISFSSQRWSSFFINSDIEMKGMVYDKRNRFVNQLDNLTKILYFFWLTKHHRLSLESCSSCPTDTMNITFWLKRYIMNNNMT